MAADHHDDDQNAEVVPLRPDPGPPGNLPAVPGEGPAETAQADGARPVIYADITGQPGERRDIIPRALQRENLRGTIATFAGLNWHRARYHGLRLPFYLLALALFAVIGLARLIVRQVHWWWLLEQEELRSEAAAAGDAREWRSLHKEAKQTRKVRGGILAAEAAVAGVAVALLLRDGQWWIWPEIGVCVVPLLALHGRPDGRRIIAPAVVPPHYRPLTRDLVSEALGSLGNANINRALKDGPGIVFLSDPYCDGPGWAVQFDLPQGVTAAWLIAHRPELASGLRRPLSATWPEGVPEEHEGRVSLWVGFHDITKMKQPKWHWLSPGLRTSSPACRSAPTRGSGR